MPEFSVHGGDSFTWSGQGMDIILGCLFPVLWAIFVDLAVFFFHFWQRPLGSLWPNILYVVETA